MDYYINLHLRPDPEFTPAHLMSTLHLKLHRALVKRADGNIGISFPESSTFPLGLGSIMRLHGSSSDLANLMSDDWLTGMRDHVQVDNMQRIPDGCQHRHVRRTQSKSSPERLRRRRMKRHNIDAHTAANEIPGSAQERLKLPFVRISSSSTGQSFLLFIEQGPLLDSSSKGHFSAYGLSRTATIPWF